MWVPYVILAVATVLIGLAGPYVESFFTHALAITMTPLAGTVSVVSSASEQQAALIATAGSLIMLLVGGFFGYMLYISRRLSPTSLVGEKGFAGRSTTSSGTAGTLTQSTIGSSLTGQSRPQAQSNGGSNWDSSTK